MVVRNEDGKSGYTYAAEPLSAVRKRGKEQHASLYPANIMYDRRVVRGNTYAAQILPAEAPYSTTARTRRRKAATRSVPPPATPPPVQGRLHTDIQTEAFLEEITDLTPEENAETQTDPFLDRPITPRFIPQKRGIDAGTQIEDGDLFDFDFEVEPMLEVLIGKTLEQGLMEVLQEEELKAMRAHQEHYEQLRTAEIVATQKLEAAERRKAEEKARRVEQERERLARQATVHAKVAAGSFARQFLSGMLDSVFESLTKQGYFYDPVERTVRDEFLPQLCAAATAAIARRDAARAVVAALSADALAASVAGVAAARAAGAAREAALQAAKEGLQAARTERAGAADALAKGRSARILHELAPRVASQAKIKATRAALEAKAEDVASAVWEEAKVATGEAARAATETAADEARAERAAKAMGKEQQGGDGDTPEKEQVGDEAAAGAEEVEAAVARAVATVSKPEPMAVSDDDVLSVLMEGDAGLKDAVVMALAWAEMGSEAWVHDPRFEAELAPTEADDE